MKTVILLLSSLFAPDADPPPDTDLCRFPSLAEAKAAIEWGEEHRARLTRSWLNEREDPEWWKMALDDCDRALQAWWDLRAAHEAPDQPGDWGEGEWSRTAWLRALRDEIGPDAYRAGKMPTLTPYARRLYAPWIR